MFYVVCTSLDILVDLEVDGVICSEAIFAIYFVLESYMCAVARVFTVTRKTKALTLVTPLPAGPIGAIVGVVVVVVVVVAIVAVTNELTSSGRGLDNDEWEVDHSVWMNQLQKDFEDSWSTE